MQESIFLRALRKEPIPRTPVWIMRQAGRYLPEYRETRKQAGDFLSLCKTPKLACEVTLQPLRRFNLDAAIIFSDILTIPDAMDLGLYFAEGEGPCFHRPLTQLENITSYHSDLVVERLSYVMEAIELTRASMPTELPLLGFSGSPWTLACYMVEGRSSRSYSLLLREMYMNDKATHQLLDWLATTITLYLLAQIKAGVQAVMLFDTWGGLLSPRYYQAFSLFYMQKIVTALKKAAPSIPIILFTKGVGSSLIPLAKTGATAIGVDWTIDLQSARTQVGEYVALQGNLDPAVLLTNKATIEREVMKVLNAYGNGSGHIFNLGHGITPDVPPLHVQIMLDAIKYFSPEFHH